MRGQKKLENVMKKQFGYIVALSAFGCAGPLLSETAPNDVQLCLAALTTDAVTDGCATLRTAYRTTLGACMAARQPDAQRSPATSAGSISHGFKARYLLCTGEARDSLAGLGN